MACVNHPTVPSVAHCKTCGDELCGTCARFLDSGEYCEKHASVAEADAYMKSRNRQRESLEGGLAQARMLKEVEDKERSKGADKDRMYIWGGVSVASLMLFTSMGLYAYPNLFTDSEVIAQQRSIMRLEECRQVFEAIGIMLSEGDLPGDSMRCPGTNIPNIVSRTGNSVRVSHPNPGQYGLRELYVTSDSHRVVMVEAADQS